MKLRNKKTGEICELASIRQYWREEKDGGMGYCLITSLVDGGEQFVYNSLAELNEEWEDYKPAEPLIKDEKIRKAVRAWAEVNGIKSVAFENYDDENIYFIDRDYEPQIWFPNKSVLWSSLDDGKIYSIAELCGEEEE